MELVYVGVVDAHLLRGRIGEVDVGVWVEGEGC